MGTIKPEDLVIVMSPPYATEEDARRLGSSVPSDKQWWSGVTEDGRRVEVNRRGREVTIRPNTN